MPVKNHFLKNRPAKEHYNPVAIQCGPQARSGHVIKCVGAVDKSTEIGLRAVFKEQHKFQPLKLTDRFEVRGKLAIDMKDLQVRRPNKSFSLSQSVEHQLDHVALSVEGRRSMGEDDQFHFWIIKLS